MRVAVCISGQLRCVDATYHSIYENVIEPNQADVFIHSWFDENHPYADCVDKNRISQIPSSMPSHVVELYKPKKHLFEKPKDFSRSYAPIIQVPETAVRSMINQHKGDYEKTRCHLIKSVKSMVYSIHKANELKELYAEEEGITYDFVIRIRFDTCIEAPVNIAELNLDRNTLYYANINQADEMVCDWFNVGSNTVMNVMASLYYLFEYFNTYHFLPKDSRRHVSLHGDNHCFWGFEYYIRDIMDVLRVPQEKLHIPIKLNY